VSKPVSVHWRKNGRSSFKHQPRFLLMHPNPRILKTSGSTCAILERWGMLNRLCAQCLETRSVLPAERLLMCIRYAAQRLVNLDFGIALFLAICNCHAKFLSFIKLPNLEFGLVLYRPCKLSKATVNMGLLFNVFLAVFAATGSFLFGYDSGVMTIVIKSPNFLHYFNTTTASATIGAINATFSGGAFFGSFMGVSVNHYAGSLSLTK
jgi:hypothetical protein